jgi:hypothetical protein
MTILRRFVAWVRNVIDSTFTHGVDQPPSDDE